MITYYAVQKLFILRDASIVLIVSCQYFLTIPSLLTFAALFRFIEIRDRPLWSVVNLSLGSARCSMVDDAVCEVSVPNLRIQC